MQLSPLSRVMERSGQLGLAPDTGEQRGSFEESSYEAKFYDVCT